MEDFKRSLFFVWIFLKAGQTDASSWTSKVPSSVKGVLGSHVVIPCSFDYPDPEKKGTKFTGIWKTKPTEHVVYHTDKSKIMQQYQDRTELGNVAQKNCSLKIDHIKESDEGSFYFRIEIESLNSYSFQENSVFLNVLDKPNMAVSVKEEVLEGETVTASCSVSPFYPTSVFSWSHSGEQLQSQQFNDGQWKATATLTFRPTHADHNKPLLCNITLNGGRHSVAFQVLKVKYAPVNVKVEYKADVKEGETVQLECSSDAHPPASTVWHNESGAELHQGNIYMLPNVSRHISALYCTAINTVGEGKSSLVHISVLHAPEIKPISSCSSEGDMVKCMCIVESKPSCMVHFVLSDRILTGTKVEKHGSVTIGTLQGAFQSSKSVECLTNNTEGNATLTLSLPVSVWTDKMQNLYIVIAVETVVFLVVLVTTVGFVKKRRGNSGATPTHHMNANLAAEEFSECTTSKRKEMEYDLAQNPGYDDNDHIYGNIETDLDDDIYTNV